MEATELPEGEGLLHLLPDFQTPGQVAGVLGPSLLLPPGAPITHLDSKAFWSHPREHAHGDQEN